MKRKCVALLMGLLFTIMLVGCSSDTVTVTGTIKEVYENGFLMYTDDPSLSDVTSVGYDKKDIELYIGQKVTVEALPEVRETYPVQITAVKVTPAQEEYQKITAEQAKTMMDSQIDMIIVDVRTPQEYAQGHIAGAIQITDTDIAAMAPEKLPDKNQKILLYCRSGKRSEQAAKKLLGMGYTDILDFGGVNSWPYGLVTN